MKKKSLYRESLLGWQHPFAVTPTVILNVIPLLLAESVQFTFFSARSLYINRMQKFLHIQVQPLLSITYKEMSMYI